MRVCEGVWVWVRGVQGGLRFSEERIGGAVVGRVCMHVRTTETEVKPEDASRTGAW